MKQYISRSAAALALAATCLSAQAANVSLSGWAYGNGNRIDASSAVGAVTAPAGAFIGTLSGTAGMDATPFVTYSVELGQDFFLSTGSRTDYEVVEGATYFQDRRGDGAVAERLGRLMTYAYENPQLSTGSGGSTALQVAIWSLVYNSPEVRARGNTFRDSSIYNTPAQVLLNGAAGVTSSLFDVMVLASSSNQDFMLLKTRQADITVPEPGSLGLAAAALAALAIQGRRSRRKAMKASTANSARL